MDLPELETKVKAEEAAIITKTAPMIGSVKTYYIPVAFFLGALLGFIAGHIG